MYHRTIDKGLKSSVKSFLTVVCMSVMSAYIVSCGEDRTYEYDELTMPGHYAEDMMKANYLWGDSLKPLEWKDYFASPAAFLEKLTKQAPNGDKWSYVNIDTLLVDHHERGTFNHVNSYGLDYVIMIDPTGETTKQYARILNVYPQSPAFECGLERGCFVSLIDGEKVTSKNIEQLKQGRSRTLTVNELGYNAEDGSLFLQSENTVMMGSSRKVDEGQVMNSFMVNSTTAYIMLTNLDGDEGVPALKSLLKTNPRTVIVDLRLCNQGTIDKALEFASLLSDKSGTFLNTTYKTSRSGENKSYMIDTPNYTGEIFFITGNYTQGASEWLIQGLKSMSDEGRIHVYGTPSAGQDLLLEEMQSPYSYTLHYAAAFVTDCTGSPAAKVVPDVKVDEYEYVQLYPYGHRNEVVLNMILNGE